MTPADGTEMFRIVTPLVNQVRLVENTYTTNTMLERRLLSNWSSDHIPAILASGHENPYRERDGIQSQVSRLPR
jgi:hypothetical protein